MNRHATRTEAIDREIIEAIEAGDATAAEYDIEAIADEVLGDHAAGYACQVTPEKFWAVVAEHARPTYEVDMSAYEQFHMRDKHADLIVDEQGEPQWFTILSVLGYDGDDLAGEICVPVSDQWVPEVYREGLTAAGWTVVGEIPETFTPTLTVVRTPTSRGTDVTDPSPLPDHAPADMRGDLGGVTINLADPQRQVGLLDPFAMTMQETGERIAAIRSRLGLTRADLAALLDVSWESVKNWETGKRAYKPGVWYDLLALQDRHDNEVATHVQAFQANSPRQPLLVIAEGVGAMPVGWQRTVAAEVLRKIPNLIITTPGQAGDA